MLSTSLLALTLASCLYQIGSATPLSSVHAVHARDGDGLDATQKANFITLTNQIRAKHDANPLKWNETLADAGARWANKCVFEHSGGTLGPYGENLAAGTGSYDVPDAMGDWTGEESSYDPSNPQPSHYTQIVWKNTKQFGCGLAPACAGIFPASYGPAKYYVCEYFPAGNVIGEFGQNVS